MKKTRTNKGFTLAELLIVVAIIAVLVAIAIPVFNTQLEKSREAVDLANIRSMYAEAAMVVLNRGVSADGETSGVTQGAITCEKDATKGYVKTVTIADFDPKQQTAGWNIDVSDVAGVSLADYKPAKAAAKVSIKFTFNDEGKLTAVSAG